MIWTIAIIVASGLLGAVLGLMRISLWRSLALIVCVQAGLEVVGAVTRSLAGLN